MRIFTGNLPDEMSHIQALFAEDLASHQLTSFLEPSASAKASSA